MGDHDIYRFWGGGCYAAEYKPFLFLLGSSMYDLQYNYIHRGRKKTQLGTKPITAAAAMLCCKSPYIIENISI